MYEGKVFYEWMGRRIAEKTENPDILLPFYNSARPSFDSNAVHIK